MNSTSSFQVELQKAKRKFGIMGRSNFRKLVDFLRMNNMGEKYENIIKGGKDNTTAVVGSIKR